MLGSHLPDVSIVCSVIRAAIATSEHESKALVLNIIETYYITTTELYNNKAQRKRCHSETIP